MLPTVEMKLPEKITSINEDSIETNNGNTKR